MKIIVIGSQGFVGKHLCDNLVLNKIPYIGVDCKSEDVDLIQKDITDFASLQDIVIDEDDIVVHLAARQYADKPPRKHRAEFFNQVNVVGLNHVLTTMLNKGCHKLIYFSSDMVYGLPQTMPIKEDHQQQPIAEYGQSKQMAEQLCERFREKGLSITLFRPRLIVGPGRLGVLDKMFRLIDKNWPIPLIGNGRNYYQMVSVFDCVSAILRAVRLDCPNANFNLGSEQLISIKDLLKSLIQSVGSQSKLIPINAKMVKVGFQFLEKLGIELLYLEQYSLADKFFYVDIENTKKQLNWAPQFNDHDMLCTAFQWYKSNLSQAILC